MLSDEDRDRMWIEVEEELGKALEQCVDARLQTFAKEVEARFSASDEDKKFVLAEFTNLYDIAKLCRTAFRAIQVRLDLLEGRLDKLEPKQ